MWNSLPNSVIDADAVDLFKARLDKFWLHQNVKDDVMADQTGIGNPFVKCLHNSSTIYHLPIF